MQDAEEFEQEAKRLAARFEGVNKAKFAREHGIPGGASMVSQHIHGHRTIGLDAATAYARGFGVGLEEISRRLAAQVAKASHLHRTVPDAMVVRAEEPAPGYGYIRLPVLAEAAAGAGRVSPEYGEILSQVDVLESWARRSFGGNPSTLKLLTVRGHSMTGVVEDGDVLFIRPGSTFDDNGLYVYSVGDLLRVKRLTVRELDGQLLIESTDGSAPQVGSLADIGTRLHIHGKVVGAWGFKRT